MENQKAKFLVPILLTLSFFAIGYQVLIKGEPEAEKETEIEIVSQTEEQPKATSDSAPEEQLCPQVFDPVCGLLNKEEKTFANSCEAEKGGATDLKPGICSPLESCPNDIDPVCGELDGEKTSFENLCKAEAAGASGIEPGSCPTPEKTQDASSDCSDELRQVCGEKNGEKITFNNQCEAKEAGAINIIEGKCPLDLNEGELIN